MKIIAAGSDPFGMKQTCPKSEVQDTFALGNLLVNTSPPMVFNRNAIERFVGNQTVFDVIIFHLLTGHLGYVRTDSSRRST